jgi:hypothetical protein
VGRKSKLARRSTTRRRFAARPATPRWVAPNSLEATRRSFSGCERAESAPRQASRDDPTAADFGDDRIAPGADIGGGVKSSRIDGRGASPDSRHPVLHRSSSRIQSRCYFC